MESAAARHLPEKKKAMKQTFSIPEPCHEQWNDMTPNEQGRHCTVCSKTVIDFSGWDEDEIAAYLFANQATGTCGRLRAAQVNTTAIAPSTYLYQVMQSGLDYLKKVAAILLFAVCIGGAAFAQQPLPKADTTSREIMGKIAPPVRQPVKHVVPSVRPRKQQHITGLIAPMPYPAKPVEKQATEKK